VRNRDLISVKDLFDRLKDQTSKINFGMIDDLAMDQYLYIPFLGG